jgi:hypothetical protein
MKLNTFALALAILMTVCVQCHSASVTVTAAAAPAAAAAGPSDDGPSGLKGGSFAKHADGANALVPDNNRARTVPNKDKSFSTKTNAAQKAASKVMTEPKRSTSAAPGDNVRENVDVGTESPPPSDVSDCQHDCCGNGVCSSGKCKCHMGWTTASCCYRDYGAPLLSNDAAKPGPGIVELRAYSDGTAPKTDGRPKDASPRQFIRTVDKLTGLKLSSKLGMAVPRSMIQPSASVSSASITWKVIGMLVLAVSMSIAAGFR